jgi:GNAT superfamily N-acetyltransferase
MNKYTLSEAQLMPTYKIIKLTPADFPKCGNIWDMNRNPKQTEYRYNELVSGNRTIFVYTENDEFLGEAALVFDAGDPDYSIPGRRIYLSRMVVKLSERGRGIGGILLDYVCDYARSLGYIEISLGVDKVNVGAWHLYKKKGFDTILFDGADEMGEYVKLLKIL